MEINYYYGQGRHFDVASYLISKDHSIYAECAVPEGASEDYGYLTMKKAIIAEMEKRGMDTSIIDWPCNDELLEDDAADGEAFVDIN